MQQPNQLLASVAAAIADGQAVDWTVTESEDLTPDDRLLLSQLRVLENVQAVHQRARVGWVGLEAEPRPDAHLFTWRHLQVLDTLGTGAFGVVYRAWDPQLASEVALKVLARDTSFGALVIGEASLLARVRHPNIVSIYGADRFNGEVGLWMELVRGRTLGDLVRQRGTFGAREAALVGLDLTRALAAVHAAGLVHRDVKAQNVMREEGGRIVLMDFGAGVEAERSAARARLIGTPIYMAPEQFDRPESTPQSDIYSLGVLLFHIVSGSFPIDASDVPSAKAAHRNGKRRRLRDIRPDLPAEFVRVVERALHPDVRERYATAGEFEADLAEFVVRDERRSQGAISARRRQSELRRALLAAALATLVLATAGIAGWMYWSRRDRPPEYPTTAAGIRSLAVLPFANLTGDPAQDYFVDGMTDLLNDHLASIPSLRVTSRTSAMSFKDAKQPAPRIGSALNVEGLIEGSVARDGDRIRVTVQLIHAGTDMRLWGDSYEREFKDAFRLQFEIARTVAGELNAALTDRERQRLAEPYIANPTAQDLYLQGRYHLHSFNRDQMIQARGLFERAVEVDPKYASAWAGLARCYTLLENIGVLPPSEAAALANHAAQTALTHDVSMYEAYTALADVRFKFDWDWATADSNYRQALDANPNFSFAHSQYARFLSAAGDLDRAMSEARRAEELDPVSPDMKRTVTMMLFYARRYEEAVAKATEIVEQENGRPGGYFVRGRARASLGHFDEALADLKQALALTNDSAYLAEIGRVLAVAGRTGEAEDVLRQLTERPGIPAAQDMAYIQAALGRSEEALAGLSSAIDQRSSRILWLRVDPRVDALRQAPGFQAMVRRIGSLPERPRR